LQARPLEGVIVPDRGSTPRSAGGAQALALIIALTLPITPLLSLAPNLPQLFQHFAGVPHADYLVPMIVTMPAVCIALLSPVAGAIADRFGRRRMLVIAAAVFTVFGVLPFWLDSLWAVLASLFVVGAAEAFIMSCGNALLGDYFAPEPRKRWLGVQGVLGSILATLVMLAGGTLGNLSWHAPFLVNLLGGIVFVWLLLYTWETGRAAQPAGQPSGQAAPLPAAAPGAFPWSSVLPIYAVTFVTGIFYFFQIEMGLLFSKLGVTTPQAVSVITTIASIGVIGGGWYFRQQRMRPVAFNILLIFLTYGIGFAGVGMSKTYLTALPFAIIAQFGNGLFVPTFVSWALSTLAPDYRARGMGLWTSAFFCCQFLSPAILTLVAQSRGGNMLTAIMFVGIACMIPAAFAALRLSKPAAPVGVH
jgi:MFS family permease